jgi:short-subunit dehydrogenase
LTVLITGATDGIGLSLAECYNGDGQRLILAGRRELPASGMFDEETYCRVDLKEDDAAERVRIFLEHTEVDRIDRLILNAGTGYWGRSCNQSQESILDTIAVNLSSSVALIQGCQPYLERANGRIVLVGSVVAALPCPGYSVYGATKAAVDGLGRSLRHELAPRVSVQVIHPGATRSGLHGKIGVDRSQIDWTRFPPAEDVAKKIHRAIEGRSGGRKFLGLGEGFIWQAGRKFPRLIDA